MNNFEIMEKIVREGNSKIFKDWHEHAGITEEDFLTELKWLCEDTCDKFDRLTRELGCDPKRGLVRLKRVNDPFTAFYEVESHKLWCGRPSISARDRI